MLFHDDVSLLTHLPLSIRTVGDKSGAQHGAAARAFDCLSLRKYKPVGMMSVHLGDEEPYMSEEEAPPLPTTMPNDIRQKVETEHKRITNRRKQQMARSQAPTVDSTYTYMTVECAIVLLSLTILTNPAVSPRSNSFASTKSCTGCLVWNKAKITSNT